MPLAMPSTSLSSMLIDYNPGLPGGCTRPAQALYRHDHHVTSLAPRRPGGYSAAGCAVDDEEFEQGIRAISAAIWDLDGNVSAALCIPGPVHHVPPERMQEIVDALLEACNAISALVPRA